MKRGRKAFRHLNSKQLRKQTKKMKVDLGVGKHRRHETLKCNGCKRENLIYLNNETVIDDNVRKTYICLFCKAKKLR